jgi:hypothetical protein
MAPMSVLSPSSSRIIKDIKCLKCKKVVRNGILCDKCDCWHHFRCSKILEDEIPDENSECSGPACVNLQRNLASPTQTPTDVFSNELDVLNAIIVTLIEEIKLLTEENKRLKDNCVNCDYELSRKISESRLGLGQVNSAI